MAIRGSILFSFFILTLGADFTPAWGQTPARMGTDPVWNLEIRGCGDPTDPRSVHAWLQDELDTQLEPQLQCTSQISAKAGLYVAELRRWLAGDYVHASSRWRRTEDGRLAPLLLRCLAEGEAVIDGVAWQPGALLQAMRPNMPDRSIVLNGHLLLELRGGRGELANYLVHELLHFMGLNHRAGRDLPYLVEGACGPTSSAETRRLAQRLADPALNWISEEYLRGFARMGRAIHMPPGVALGAAFAAGLSFYSPEARQVRVGATLEGLLETRIPRESDDATVVALAFYYAGRPLPAEWANVTPAFYAPLAQALHAALQGDVGRTEEQLAMALAERDAMRPRPGLARLGDLMRQLLRTSEQNPLPTDLPAATWDEELGLTDPFSARVHRALSVISAALN